MFTSGNWFCTTSGVNISCLSNNTAGIPINTSVQFDVPVVAASGSVGKTLSINGTILPTTNEAITNNNGTTMTVTTPVQSGARPDVTTTVGPIPALTEGVTSQIPVTLANIGNAPATGELIFSTTLPNGLTTPANFTTNGAMCTTSGQTVTCKSPNIAGLAPAANTVFELPVTPIASSVGTTPSITATTTPVPTETVTANNTSAAVTATAPVTAMPRPDVTTTVGTIPTLTEGVTSQIPVTLANIGNAPAMGELIFSTTLPNGLTTPANFTTNGAMCTTSGQTVTCKSPNTAGLLPNADVLFELPVTPAVGSAGQTPSITVVTSPVPNETVTPNNTSASVAATTPIAAMPRPDVTTTVGTIPTLTEGVTSQIPVTLANIGNAPAMGELIFSTTLPNGLTTPANFTTNGAMCTTSGQTVTCKSPNTAGLLPNADVLFELPVTPAVGSAGQTPSISATTTPVPNETVTPNNTSASVAATTPIAAMPRPDVTTTVGSIPTLTEGVTSQIPVTLANIGNAPATGELIFSTTLPNGLTTPANFTTNGAMCTTSGQTVTCKSPNTAGLLPNADVLFNLPVTPAVGSAGQTPSISATTTPVTNETVTPNNTSASVAATTPIAASLKPDVTTTVGPIPTLTEGVTSQIPVTLANIGNAPATGELIFSTTLPNGLTTPANFTTNGAMCTTSGQTVTCKSPNTAGLAPNANTVFNLPVTPAVGSAGQTPSISATTTPVPNEIVTANNTSATVTATAPINATPRPDLQLTFGTPSPALTTGQTSFVPVTVTNVGTLNAAGQLVLTFNIPNNTTSPLSYSGGNGWVCNPSGSTLTCVNTNAAGIAPGAATTFNIQLIPNANTAGQFVILNGTVATVANETVTLNNSSVQVVTLPIVAGNTVLNVKVMLQGAMLNTTDGLMRDNLRTLNLIPLTSPYKSTLSAKFTNVAETVTTTTIAVLNANAGTSDAIVDWVFVELRNPANPATVVQTFSALVQRDGDVIGADGQSLKTTLSGNYMVSVKHRNHLGVMKATSISILSGAVTVDFTTMSDNEVFNNAGYDGIEMTTVNGKRALWAGNCNSDAKTKYDGTSTDRQKIADNVLQFTGNAGSYVFNNAIGYFMGDVNMDGKAKYDGLGNDRLIIQQIVQSYDLNSGLANNYNNFLEQLP